MKKETASPEEEALYGPAPVPHRAESVASKSASSGGLPIGSRANSTVQGGKYFTIIAEATQ